MKCIIIIIIIIYFSFIYLFCRRNGHMWLISSWKDEGLIEHVQYKYNHSFLIEEISYVTTVPRCNHPHSPLMHICYVSHANHYITSYNWGCNI